MEKVLDKKTANLYPRQVSGLPVIDHIYIKPEKDADAEKVEVTLLTTFLGRYTHTKVNCIFNDLNYTSEGLSRRSKFDKPSDEVAYKISVGRAIKSLKNKINGKFSQNLLMA